MIPLRICPPVLGIGWNFVSPLDKFLPRPPPSVCLVRVTTSCRRRARSNSGSSQRKRRQKVPLDDGGFNGHSSSTSFDNMENESDVLNIRKKSAEQVPPILYQDTTVTKPITSYNKADATHGTLESSQDVVHTVNPSAKPSPENYGDASSDRIMDSAEGFLFTIPGKEHYDSSSNNIEDDPLPNFSEKIMDVDDSGLKPWLKDEYDASLDRALDSAEEPVFTNYPEIVPTTGATENLYGPVVCFSDHPVVNGLCNSNGTQNALFSERCADEITSHADLVADNAHQIEPAIDAGKQMQEGDLNGSIGAPNMTTPHIHHLPAHDEWSSFTNYKSSKAPELERDENSRWVSRDEIDRMPEMCNLSPRTSNRREEFNMESSPGQDAYSGYCVIDVDVAKYTEPSIAETGNEPLHFEECDLVEDAQFSDVDMVSNNAYFTEPVTDRSKPKQEFDLDHSIDVFELTKPVIPQLLVSGDVTSSTTYNNNGTYCACSSTDAIKNTEPTTKEDGATLHFEEGSLVEAASGLDLVNGNTDFTKRVIDSHKPSEEFDLDGSIDADDMTMPLARRPPMHGDCRSFTDCNGTGTYFASSVIDAANYAEPAFNETGCIRLHSEEDSLVEIASYSDTVIDNAHFPELVTGPNKPSQGLDSDCSIDEAYMIKPPARHLPMSGDFTSFPDYDSNGTHSSCSATHPAKYVEPVLDETGCVRLYSEEGSLMEEASYADVIDNECFTEVATDPSKQSQEVDLDFSNAVADMTKPSVHQLPISGYWTPFTDCNCNGTRTDSLQFEDYFQEGTHSVCAANNAAYNTELVLKNVQDAEAKETMDKVYPSKQEIHLEDLLAVIHDAERNVILLNQARTRAVEAVDQMLKENEQLQRKGNMLEMRLSATESQLDVETQEHINVEPFKEQLQELRTNVSWTSPNNGENFSEVNHTTPGINGSVIDMERFSSISDELNTLKEENISLRFEFDALKPTVADVTELNEKMLVMDKGTTEALGDLELKLASVQESFTNYETLKSEFDALCGKVEHLQYVVNNTCKRAEETSHIVQRNHELWKKIDELEASLKEVRSHQLSSEQSQQHNKLLERQIGILEEHVLKSDREIQSQVKMYSESVNEFNRTLQKIKEERDRRKLEEPVDNMPWDFWSHLLLCLDSWLLEKKISFSDAKALREMAWKRDARIRDVFMTCKDKQESEAVSSFLKLISSHKSSGMHVVHIAAEMAPVAKVGGLGDVVSGLGKALQRRGHLVEIILPKYDCMQYSKIDNLKVLNVEVPSYYDGQLFKNKIWVGIIEGLPVYFIEPHHPAKFFWRGKFYGENDDFRRFSFFSRAALEFLHKAGKKPDIIHCHDWQTAFTAPLYWQIYAPKGLNSAKICFTCHNFEHQGTAPASDLASIGLNVIELNRQDRMQDSSSHDRVNSVKGGIVFSNIVTTVSPTYAQEVQTADGGRGLHPTLHAHSEKFFGILNGIDTEAWNPATDAFIRFRYTANDLQGKKENKDALRKHLGLAFADNNSMPMVGCVTRLVPQKGVHLIRHAIHRTLELGGQFVLLGSSPVPHIQHEFEEIASLFHKHQHVRLILKYDEALAHTIYAASDMLVIPSMFEPCGLTQMISMRYGSIPIVRRTGGLNDSVFDVNDDTIPLQLRNGFIFTAAGEQDLNGALNRAFEYYKRDPEKWQQLVKRVMCIDFSWVSSAKQYEDLYEKSLEKARVSIHR